MAGFKSQIGDAVRMSDLGIDLNVRIQDLTMESIDMALHRMFRLMQGRPGYISMTAGALLRSLTGDALRLWYTSSNGIKRRKDNNFCERHRLTKIFLTKNIT